ncbi:TRAP transporter small permease [Pacificibacter marinus]|uniref:TRAP transporter small permease n=1 Tax=Pacificibacter marinus TaxID=658057 RepID=UPI001C07B8CF|nr:TRAP transporter small permease [Pacificibacter marinus]MBU2867825.1 TRAP transporter small permease subunit [Pacificibacter marinus]
MIPRALSRLSSGFSAIERFLLKFLIGALAVFILTNVLLRMFGITLAWADELAIYTMVLSGFVGASLMLRARIDPAVLLLHTFVPHKVTVLLRATVSLISAAFGILLLYLCVRWFNPVVLMQNGFDTRAFEAQTFNFIYTDMTPVMAIPTYFLYFIVPFFALGITIHATTNLLEDLGFLTRPNDPAGLKMDNI